MEEEGGDGTFTEDERSGVYHTSRAGQDWDAREERMKGEMRGEVESVRMVLTGLERRMMRREEELRAIIKRVRSAFMELSSTAPKNPIVDEQLLCRPRPKLEAETA
jgi:hypothetical protein